MLHIVITNLVKRIYLWPYHSSGKRLVPIMTAFFCTILAVILLLIWPPVFNGIVTFGKWIVGMGPFGALLYGFNRLLIPTGLHHALNNVFWFDTAGINDIGKFQSGKMLLRELLADTKQDFPSYDVWYTGSSFGDVSYCEDESKTSLRLVLASSVSAFFVGVTEPIEFAFMFVAPVLFVIHAVLTGLSLFIAAMFHWTAGFHLVQVL